METEFEPKEERYRRKFVRRFAYGLIGGAAIGVVLELFGFNIFAL